MATDEIASAIRALGTGNAASEMGAIEFLAASIKEAGESIAASLDRLAEAVENSNA